MKDDEIKKNIYFYKFFKNKTNSNKTTMINYIKKTNWRATSKIMSFRRKNQGWERKKKKNRKEKTDDAKLEVWKLHMSSREGGRVCWDVSNDIKGGRWNPPYMLPKHGGATDTLTRTIHLLIIFVFK